MSPHLLVVSVSLLTSSIRFYGRPFSGGKILLDWQPNIYHALNTSVCLDDWLTVHLSITLVDLQLDAQNSYLFTYITFIKTLYMFRALLCSS